MSETVLRRLAAFPLATAAVALLFRMFVWQSWGPAAGEPYGASDLVEVLLLGVTMLGAATAFAAAAWIVTKTPRRSGLALALACGAVAGLALHWFAHPLVPTWRLW